jgi:hypothetical protein
MTDELESPWDRATKSKSVRQEESLSKLQGGRKQINSGRTTWTSKRDNILGRIYTFLVEARTTDRGSYRIEKKEFLELRKNAFQTPPGLLPMFQIDIQDLSLVVLELKDMEEFQTRMLDLETKLNERILPES